MNWRGKRHLKERNRIIIKITFALSDSIHHKTVSLMERIVHLGYEAGWAEGRLKWEYYNNDIKTRESNVTVSTSRELQRMKQSSLNLVAVSKHDL